MCMDEGFQKPPGMIMVSFEVNGGSVAGGGVIDALMYLSLSHNSLRCAGKTSPLWSVRYDSLPLQLTAFGSNK